MVEDARSAAGPQPLPARAAGPGSPIVGAVFVATSYRYLFLEDQPEKVTAAAEPAERA